jgi:hypothetical protein
MTSDKPRSERTSVTASERLTLIGLTALAASHQSALKDIERSMLEITRELDSDGKREKVWGGGSTGDACTPSEAPEREVDQLLWRLNLRIDNEAPSIVPAALSLVEQLSRFTDPRKSSEPSDELDTFARMIDDAKEIVGDNAAEDA